MAYRFFSSVLLLSLSIFFSPLQATETTALTQSIKHGAVASPDQYGALVAEQILRKGGNAVDAAIATAFTLAVTYPEAGNIGGGGFMLVWFDGKPYFLDYRETAPAAAHKDMFLNADMQVIENL
ncbi:MAG: gamma-glutamyltransferase, partial [Pararheinheimera sp.]|nr:gamma-glutamyltransferase [Rheinheimera sp.]